MRIKNSDFIRESIGDECRSIRKYGLEMSLQQLANKTGMNLKTLSGFENGRSSNMYIFYVYYQLLDTDTRISFIKRVLERIE